MGPKTDEKQMKQMEQSNQSNQDTQDNQKDNQNNQNCLKKFLCFVWLKTIIMTITFK